MCNCNVAEKDEENISFLNDNLEENCLNNKINNVNSQIIDKNNDLQPKSKNAINVTDIHNTLINEDITLYSEKYIPDNIQISENTNKLYNLFNDPSKNKRIWTKEEDEFLLDYLKKNNNSRNWKKISEILKTKTPQQCTYRYNKLIEQMTKRKWTRGEDIKLIELIEVYNKNWELIAKEFPHRSLKEIEERFTKKLDPCMKKSRFSEDEDDLLIKLYEKYGNQWSEISKQFKNRTVPVLKNRLFSFLRNRVTKDYPNLNNSSVNSMETSSNNNNKSLSNKSLSISGNADQWNMNNRSMTFNNSHINKNESYEFKAIEENKTPKNLGNKHIQDNFNLNPIERHPQIIPSEPIYMFEDSFSHKPNESEYLFKNYHDNNHLINDSLFFEDINKFDTKFYSFPNDEPFFHYNNEDQMLIDENSENIFNTNDPHSRYNLELNETNLNNNEMNISNLIFNTSDIEEIDILMKDLNHPYIYLNNINSIENIDLLYKEINKLDIIVDKVFDLYNIKNKDLINLKSKKLEEKHYEKFIILNKKIDDRVSVIHSQLNYHKKQRVSLKASLDNLKNYIKKELELLIQLIYSTKLKGKLIYTVK